ncbi:MAG: menaquinone biosynthesis protein [Acidobacteria bacterium]|nr:menaquinone biosynthesis protein [Acidobacteriota bacterium]MCA1652154.1 menaquinone biosynthesis protein [Acidobacteriota bacterium]
MTPIHLGAVNYLNARPLVYGLELRSQLFSVRFDTPSKCAALLHEGSIDVGMIPSIEYLRGHGYRIVPGLGIVSEGPVASVAVFSSRSIDQVRSVALDTSSRTSNALLQVLCYELFGVDPKFIPMPPVPDAMLARCDAALIIGDPALFFDHAAAGVLKVDLGEQWTAMTGLPFVWAFWAGRRRALTAEAIDALTEARDAGVRQSDALAAAFCGPARAARAQAYLRDNIRYTLGPREEVGLMRFYELAAKHSLVEDTGVLEYF